MALRSRCAEIQFSLPNNDYSNVTFTYDQISSNSLKSYLVNGDFSPSKYDTTVFITTIPWLAVGVLALFVYICLVINGIFLRRWAGHAKGIFSCCKRPKSEKHKKLYMKLGLYLGFGVLAVSVLGMIFVRNNTSDGEKAACAIVALSDSIVKGKTSANWGGVSKSVFSYDWANLIFSEEAPVVNSTFETKMTNVTLKMADYIADLDSLYLTRSLYNVSSADIADSNAPVLEPSFITNLGPKTTADTYLNLLNAEVTLLGDTLTNSSQGLNTTYPTFTAQTVAIQAELTLAAPSYREFAERLGNFTLLISNYTEANYEDWDTRNNIIMASFIVFIGLSSTLYFTIMMHHKGKVQVISQFSYISWHLFMIWVVVTAYLTAEAQELKKRVVEHCDILRTTASNAQFITDLGVNYGQNFSNNLDTCFFGNGNTFNVSGFATGGVLIDQLAKYVYAVNPYLVNGPGSTVIKAQKEILDKFLYGLNMTNTDLTDSRTPAANLRDMNLWSDYEVTNSDQETQGQCEITKDEWVLNITNCTTTPVWGTAYKFGDFFGKDVCLGMWSLDSYSVRKRYTTANFATCQMISGQSIADILANKYDGLSRHFNDVKNKFNHLKRFYENNLNGRYKDILKNATNITQPIVDFNNTLKIVLDYVAGPENGILYNSNCSFLKSDVITASKYVCEFASNMTKTVYTIAAVCSLGVVYCIFIYLYFRKLEVAWKLIDRKEYAAPNQIMPEPFSQQEINRLDRMDTGPIDDLDPAVEGERIDI